MSMITVLELFSGTGSISNEFRRRGCECFTVDWNDIFPSSLHCDIETLQVSDLPEKFQHPDIIFAAPDHRTYSLSAIRKHRKKNVETGYLEPQSDESAKADRVNQHLLELIQEMNPKAWWIEVPQGCFQSMPWMKPLEQYKHLVTYCPYTMHLPKEARKQRPTNLWTNIPEPGLLRPCKRGADCHPSRPRGQKRIGPTGMRGDILRTTYPRNLTRAIVDISLQYIESLRGCS